MSARPLVSGIEMSSTSTSRRVFDVTPIRLLARLGFGDDADVVELFEETAESRTHHGVVVDEHDLDDDVIHAEIIACESVFRARIWEKFLLRPCKVSDSNKLRHTFTRNIAA